MPQRDIWKTALHMVDHLQDDHSRFGGYVGDIVLPDLPPSAEALATRIAQRLYLRRWLLALSSSVIVIFVALYDLPGLPAMSGLLCILAGAALLPREGVSRPVRLNLRVSDRMLADRAVAGLLEGLPAPAIILNRQGRVLAFNSLARDFFPTIRQNQHLSGAIRDPGVLGGVAAADAAARARQVVSYEQRVPIERHMEVTISWIGPRGDAPGEAAPAILVHLRDLTEQERLDRLRTDFIANASHELRTPLASVLGFIETLQGAARNDPAAREHFLEIMARQAYRMKRLIDDLLSLSRVEMRLHLRPGARVDLNEVARQVLANFEPVAGKAGTAVHLSVHGNGAWVLGDREELVQMVSNLIENAIKYGRPGGNVWLSVAGEEGGRFALSVRDDGEGIADKHLPRLTERFYRASDTGGEKSGTGLGLAIVKHVVTRHRGELRIGSKIGEGSTFIVTLAEAPPPG